MRQPGFTLVVGLTLALAIGANTVIFSITNFLLLRPLPFKEKASLVAIFSVDPQRGNDRARTSQADFLEWRDRTRSFEAIGAFTSETYTLTRRGDPMRLQAQQVTANLFDIWKTDLVSGRRFLPGEDLPGAAPVVVLSHGFWATQMDSSLTAVGESLMLDGRAHTIVGILTPEMEVGNLSRIDIWTPVVLDWNSPRATRALQVYARLGPGVTVEQASTEMREIARKQAQEYPLTNDGWGANTLPLIQAMTGRNSGLVLTMLGLVVAFVLAIACANVANLMLARSVARRKELALRAALGAGRFRLVRQLLTESLLLSLIGGVAGLMLARGGLALIKAVSYEPFFRQIEVDYRVLMFVGVLSFITPLLFSLLPAIHAARLNVNQALLEGAGRVTSGIRGRRSRSVLVVAQLSLAVTLLILSTLVVKTAIAQARLDPGFDPENILTLQLELEGSTYADDERVRQFYDRALERTQNLPGVASASITQALPAFGVLPTESFEIAGRASPIEITDRPWAQRATVSPGYFTTFDIPVVRGRAFTSADDLAAPAVVLVSQEAQRRYWPDEDAVGHRIRRDADTPWMQVVGVIGDVFNRSELTDSHDPQFYVPAAQHPNRAMAFAIRTTSDPSLLRAAVRDAIRLEDADQAAYDIRSMAQVFRDQLASDRVIFGMFVAFALVALVLSGSGLYGLMSYSVAQRGQEFGVRMALGAQPRDVLGQVLRQGLTLAGAGVGIGLVGGFGLASLVASMLFGVSASDPLTYGGVAVGMTIVALFASYIPARRALSVDPIRALR